MKRHWYIYHGLAVSAWLCYALTHGWSWLPIEETRQGPKTVREQGSHRPHYGYFRRWFGGK